MHTVQEVRLACVAIAGAACGGMLVTQLIEVLRPVVTIAAPAILHLLAATRQCTSTWGGEGGIVGCIADLRSVRQGVGSVTLLEQGSEITVAKPMHLKSKHTTLTPYTKIVTSSSLASGALACHPLHWPQRRRCELGRHTASRESADSLPP